MKRYDTVIFDLDGTLLDTLEDLADALNTALRRHGYPERTIEEVRAFVGNGVRRLVRLAVPGGEEAPDFEEILEDFKIWYAAHADVKTRPYAGIIGMLEALQDAGVKMAIVSNKFDAAVKALNAKYFGSRIPVAIGENEAAGIRKKPAPDSVFEAMRQLGADPERTLYVGDSEVDHETSRQAGIDLLLVSWGFRDRKLLESFECAGIADTPEEIIACSLNNSSEAIDN